MPFVPTASVPAQASAASRESAAAGGFVPGVPQAYAAALPNVGSAGRSGSPQPYYFLDTPAAPQEDSLSVLARLGSGEDAVTAQPFALPGAEPAGLLREPARIPRGPESAASSDPRVRDSRPPLPGASAAGLFDVQAIRRDFPILSERVNGKPLIWFDNAATTQKPRAVIDRISHFYSRENSNIHRAAHELAARSTDAYEGARRKVADFLGAKGPEEIIFVRGATEGINLVAATFGRQEIREGDEILVSNLEHHANIVPWQRLAERNGARIRAIPVDDDGQLRLDEYARLLGPKTKLVAVAQVSNALGTVTPIAEITAMAHASGAKVLVDGAQSVSHMRVNVQALDADFFVFSGHKVFAPTGIGVVYGKKALLDRLPPWQGGGNMIADVTFERTIYQDAPARFEAGTGNIADAVGLGAALDYVQQVGIERIGRYEHALLEYATERLRPIPGVRLIGTAREKAGVLSFTLAGYRTEEVGAALNREGIAVRSGHHCAQPILRRFGLESTVRPSLAFYNTCEEVDVFIATVRRLAGRKA
jgi:cysteine desulfurase/selenocysteine lyase